MIKGLFDKRLTLFENALDLRAARQKVLASNIANQETPGYRARDIDFSRELARSLGDTFSGGPALVRTNARHLSAPGVSGGRPAPRIIERGGELPGYDRNTVGMESEMVRLSENYLHYNILIRFVKGKFSSLMNAIKEGGR